MVDAAEEVELIFTEGVATAMNRVNVLDLALGAGLYSRRMTMTENKTHSCGCGCSAMTDVTEAREPCGCGCECCGDGEPRTREQEIAELLTLRRSVDKRLTELSK